MPKHLGDREALTRSKDATGATVGSFASAAPPAGRTPLSALLHGKDIDPLRLFVWSLFGVLLLAAWAAIIWGIWTALG